VKQIERASEDRLVVLDTPASGHAVSFLRSPRALLDTVQVGPINTQAREALDLLTDPSRCRVLLVTIAEETPVSELIETAYRLEDELGIALGPVVVNGVVEEPLLGAVDAAAAADAAGVHLDPGQLDAIERATHFVRSRAGLQREQLDRLARELPLPQLRLPAVSGVELGRGAIDHLARAMLDGIATLDERTVTARAGR
jgi:anion-transporting  ArsA/GET3 family ATPase